MIEKFTRICVHPPKLPEDPLHVTALKQVTYSAPTPSLFCIKEMDIPVPQIFRALDVSSNYIIANFFIVMVLHTQIFCRTFGSV
jgi:hypothetical protein